MSSQELEITNLRRALIIHRILYYVYNSPAISDFDYDIMERQLKALCGMFPQVAESTPYFAICPTIVLGSDNEEDYPPELLKEAEHMLHDGA